MKTTRAAAAALVIAALAGCATSNPNLIRPYEAQRLSQVYDATVLSVRPVTIEGSQSGLGATAGAVAGGVAGSNVGGYRDGFVIGIVGAILGGIIGNAFEREATRENAVELLLQLRNGERRAVVQAGNESWRVGDPVVLVMGGGRARVSHAPATAAQPYAAPLPLPDAAAPARTSPQPVPVYPPSGPVPPRS